MVIVERTRKNLGYLRLYSKRTLKRYLCVSILVSPSVNLWVSFQETSPRDFTQTLHSETLPRDFTQRLHPQTSPRDFTQRLHPETLPREFTQTLHPETSPRDFTQKLHSLLVKSLGKVCKKVRG